MNFSPTIDIVVPCYNVSHIVKDCVTSLLMQTYSENTITIFLINDGSSDGTDKIINSFSNHQNIVIINHHNNRGLSAARNSGIKAGEGEMIFFLDSDMVVKSDWIIQHLKVIGQNGVMGVIGETHLPKGQNPNKLDYYLYDLRRGARSFGEGIPLPFQYCLFNNTSTKRSVFDFTELFDERITSYGGEDTDMAIRLCQIFPDSLYFSFLPCSEHHHKREFNDFCKSMYEYGENNLKLLIKKHPQFIANIGGEYIRTIKGYLVFNPIIRIIINLLESCTNNYWLKRYLIIDSVIRGARQGYKK